MGRLHRPSFSRRLDWQEEPNVLHQARELHLAMDRPLLDLTETNPTRVGLRYDEQEILAALAQPQALEYAPDPRGLLPAREAVASYYREHGSEVSPRSIFLTASTSEGYALLFKLLADPGDAILVPRPSYPLFEQLAALEGVQVLSYPLGYREDEGWRIETGELEAHLRPRVRAVVAVSPNNPTGSFLAEKDRVWLQELCGQRGLPLLVDEVFLDYPSPGFEGRARTLAGESPGLSCVLSGLSKVAALPQVKLGWIQLNGPTRLVEEAASRLEFVTDAYLSVSAMVQHATPRLLAGRGTIQTQIRERVEANFLALGQACAQLPGFRPLLREGGWYGVLEMPPSWQDEATALRLLKEAGVQVHPGYYYDFEEENLLVLSLLVEPRVFAEGLARAAGLFRSA